MNINMMKASLTCKRRLLAASMSSLAPESSLVDLLSTTALVGAAVGLSFSCSARFLAASNS